VVVRATREEGGEKTGCRLYLLSIEEGVPTPLKYLSVGSTSTGQKWLCRRRPDIGQGREPIWDSRLRVSVHAWQATHPPCIHPSLTLRHPDSPCSQGASVKAAWRGWGWKWAGGGEISNLFSHAKTSRGKAR